MSGSKIWLPRPWWQLNLRKTAQQNWSSCYDTLNSILKIIDNLEVSFDKADLEELFELSKRTVSAHILFYAPEHDPSRYKGPEDARFQLVAASLLKKSANLEEAKERFHTWAFALLVGPIAMEELQRRVARVPPSLSLLGALKSSRKRDAERHAEIIHQWYWTAIQKGSRFRKAVSILAESDDEWALAADDLLGIMDEALVTEVDSFLRSVESAPLELLRRLTSGQAAKRIYTAIVHDVVDEERKTLSRKAREIGGAEKMRLNIQDIRARIEDLEAKRQIIDKLEEWVVQQEDRDIRKIYAMYKPYAVYESEDKPPSQREIARRLGKSRGYVKRHLKIIHAEIERIRKEDC